MLALYVGGGVVSALVLMRVFSSKVYDVIICQMTKKWYKAVLERVEEGANVLDVGIGTATSLIMNRDIIEKKKLSFVGVDYDAAYIASAAADIQSAGLSDSISVHCLSIFDDNLPNIVRSGKELFEAAYFSGSWTLMPEPVRALHIAAALVKPDGKVYVTQTFQRKATPLLGTIKPLLKYMTTIDFGNLHFESDLENYITGAANAVNGVKLVLEDNIVVPGSIDNQYQSARILTFKKVKA